MLLLAIIGRRRILSAEHGQRCVDVATNALRGASDIRVLAAAALLMYTSMRGGSTRVKNTVAQAVNMPATLCGLRRLLHFRGSELRIASQQLLGSRLGVPVSGIMDGALLLLHEVYARDPTPLAQGRGLSMQLTSTIVSSRLWDAIFQQMDIPGGRVGELSPIGVCAALELVSNVMAAARCGHLRLLVQDIVLADVGPEGGVGRTAVDGDNRKTRKCAPLMFAAHALSAEHIRRVAVWPVCTGGGAMGVHRLLVHAVKSILLPLDGGFGEGNAHVRAAAQKLIYGSGIIDSLVQYVFPLMLEESVVDLDICSFLPHMLPCFVLSKTLVYI